MKRKRSTGLAIGLVLGAIAGVAGYFGLVAPNLEAWRYARSLSKALDGARLVTIEEYSPPMFEGPRDLVHLRVTASSEQIEMRRAATGAWKARLPDSPRCFMPHHRVKMLRADGTEFKFDVCFQCDNFQMTGEQVRAMPESWIELLRKFFTSAGMAPLDDYTAKELNHPERSLQREEVRALKEGRFIRP